MGLPHDTPVKAPRMVVCFGEEGWVAGAPTWDSPGHP